MIGLKTDTELTFITPLRSLPVTPKIVRKSYVRHKQIDIKK